MKPEAQRIAIAECCEWTDCEPCTRSLKPKTDGVEIRGLSPDGDHTGGWQEWSLLPNYIGDLNAMHEAEKILDGQQCWRYERLLHETYGDSFIWKATAAQRAEAFLRTLGLWKDEVAE